MDVITSLLQQVLTGTQQSNDALGAVHTQLGVQTGALTKTAEEMQAEGSAVVQLAGQVAQEKAAIAYTQGQVAERAQALVGLNPDDVSNELVKSVAMLNSAQDARRASRAQYDQLAGQNFFANPLGYLMGQLQLPQVVAQHNAAAAQEADAEQNIATRTTMLSQVRNNVVANTAAATRDMNLKSAQMAEKEARFNLLKAEQENSSRVAGSLLQQAQVLDKMNDNRRSDLSIVLGVENQLASREERQAMATERIALAQAKLKDKNEQDAAEAQLNLNLQRFSQFLGVPDTLTVATLKSLPKDQAAPLWQVAVSGQLGATLQESLGTVLKTPTALPTLRQHNAPVALAIEGMGTAVESYVATLVSKPGPDGKLLSTKEAIPRAFDTYEDEVVKSANQPGFQKPMNSVAWDNTYNPYKVQHKALLDIVTSGNAKFLEGNAVVKAVEGLLPSVPQERDNLRGEDESRVLAVIAERVKNRELAPKQAAAEIVRYYNAGVQITRDVNQTGVFGFAPPRRYHVTLPGQGLYGAPITADLLNPVSVEKAMLTYVRQNNAIRVAPQIESLNVPIITPGIRSLVNLFPE